MLMQTLSYLLGSLDPALRCMRRFSAPWPHGAGRAGADGLCGEPGD
jgi:glycerol-3-phosphate acyltransferase PlsY